jgi:hypothetical protein
MPRLRTFVAWTFFILFYHPHNNDGTTPRLLEEDGEGEILCGKRAFRSFRFGQLVTNGLKNVLDCAGWLR